MTGHQQLKIAATLSFVAAVLHVAIVFGGASWYRFFGAGEAIASLADSGSSYPTIVTLTIAAMLSVWGLYALSGAGVIIRLPLLKLALCLITTVYLLRAGAGFIIPFVSDHPLITQNSVTFWLVSSAVCSLFGIFYLLGTARTWQQLGHQTT